MASIDDVEVLAGIIKLYEYALLGEKWGDAVFLDLFMNHDGQAYNYLELDDLKTNLITIANGNETWVKV